MKLNILLIFLFAFAAAFEVQSQSVDWALSTNDSSYEIFYDTVVDESNEKIYTVGLVSNPAGFGVTTSNGLNSTAVPIVAFSQGGDEGLLIATDLDGNMLWSVVLSSSNSDAITGIDLLRNGDVVITGYYEHGNAKLLATNGEFTLNQQDADDKADAFYARLNGEGELIDIRSIGGLSNDIGVDIKASDESYYVLVENDVLLSTSASRLLLKINQDNDVEWQADLHNTLGYTIDFTLSQSACLAVQNNQVFVLGSFAESNFSYQDGQGVAHSYLWSSDLNTLDFFVVALNSDGSEKWAKTILQADDPTMGYGIDADCNGLYLTGSGHASLSWPMVFPGGLTFDSFDDDDIWLCALDLDTGTADWIKAFNTYGEDHGDIGFAVSADGRGNIYVAGVYKSDIFVDGFELLHSQNQDLFIVGMTNQGDINWMASIQSEDNDLGRALHAYSNDKLIVAGLGGRDLTFSSETLSAEPDNGLLMSFTLPENNELPCCSIENTTLIASESTICAGEALTLESDGIFEGFVLQFNEGSGWIDSQLLSGSSLLVSPGTDTQYRLYYSSIDCTYISNVVSIVVFDSDRIAPGGAACGLKLWMRADTLINSQVDINANEGDSVESWSEMGNYSFTAEPRNSSNAVDINVAPIWREESQNFHPGVEFQGGQNVVIPEKLLWTDKGELTTYVVVTPSIEDGNARDVVFDFGSIADGGIGVNLDQNTAGVYASEQASINSVVSLKEHAYLVKNRFVDQDQLTMVINKDTVNSNTSWIGSLSDGYVFSAEMNSDPNDGGPFSLGMNSSEFSTDESFVGEIHEVIGVVGELSDLDQQKIESYLNLKYSLIDEMTSLRNLVNSSGDVIYDSEGAYQDYRFEIAGIGVDDASDFHQRKAIGTGDGPVLEYENDVPSEDLSFFVWGNNGESFQFDQITNGQEDSRMERVWKVQESGASGDIRIYLNEAEFPGTTHLVTHTTDQTIADPERIICLQQDGPWIYAVLDLQDGEYFSFASLTITVDETINVDSCVIDNGSIEVNASGGTGNYYYDWSTSGLLGAGTNTVSALAGGDYEVTITDDSGCAISTIIILPSSPELAVDNVGIVEVLCSGNANGAIALTTSGGNGDISVNWLEGYSGASISGLEDGEYNYEITDEAGCIVIGSVEVQEPAPLSVTSFQVINLDCLENSNGSVLGSVVGGSSDYTVELGQNSETLNPLFSPSSNILSNVTDDFLFSDLSGGEYVLSIVDSNNCSFSNSFTIEILDTVAPIIFNCPADQTVSVGATCSYVVPDFFDGLIVLDECTIEMIQTPAALTELGVGLHTISLSVIDASMNESTCSFQLTLQDNQNPLIDVPVELLLLRVNEDCEVTIPDYSLLVAVTDNCGISSFSQSPLPGETRDTDFSVSLNAVDVNGNIGMIDFTVIVEDTTPPEVSCESISVDLINDCSYSVPDFTVHDWFTDNCTLDQITQNILAGTSLGVGTHAVEVTAKDEAGNLTSCEFEIVVVDTQVPAILSQSEITIEAQQNCSFTLNSWDEIIEVIDCDSELLFDGDASLGQVFPIGDHLLSLIITDQTGNSTNFELTLHVVDTVAPILDCPTDIIEVALGSDCLLELPVWEDLIGITDNCPTTISLVNIEFLDNHINNCEIEVTDGVNTSTCSVQIQGKDITPPTLSDCLSDQVVNFDSNCEFILPDYRSQISVSDVCTSSEDLIVSQMPLPGTPILVQTEITLQVIDLVSLTSECTFTVTPLDQTPPVILSCAADQEVLAIDCMALMPDLTSEVEVIDNCEITITQFPLPGTELALGDHLVVFEVSDGVNEQVTCEAIFSVADSESPQVQNISASTYPTSDNCTYELQSWETYITVSECSDFNVTMNPAPGTILEPGNQEVLLTVDDGLNPPSSITIDFDLLDDLSWTVQSCPSNSELILDESCNALLPDFRSEIDLNLSCGVEIAMEQTPAPGTSLSGQQEINVSISITGNNGVIENCAFTVTLVDDSAPLLTCENILLPAISCEALMPNVALLDWATDDCSEVTYFQSILEGESLPIGEHILIVQAFGGGAPASSCEVEVIVVDDQAPTVDCSTTDLIEIEAGCEYLIEDFTALVEVSDNCMENISIIQGFVGQNESNIGQSVTPGSYLIEFTISDGVNSVSCTKDFIVTNDQMAELICQGDLAVTIEEGDQCSRVVSYEMPTIDNSCGDEIVIQTAGLPVGAEFPVGSTTNSFDLILNDEVISSCTFDIVVSDLIDPEISCPEPITSCDPTVFYELPQATDNCSGVTIEQLTHLELSSGSEFPIGITVISYKAIDLAGNWVMCDFVVEVIEVEVPVWNTLDPTYCANAPSEDLNDQVTFSGNLSWSSNVPNGILDPENLGLGVFEIRLVGEKDGCATELSQSIEILAVPALSILADSEVCGMQTELQVIGDATTYSWTIPSGIITANQSGDAIQDVLAEEQGLFTFSVTGETNGCQSSIESAIQFWEQPGIPDAGPDQSITDTSIQLNANSDGVGDTNWEADSDQVSVDQPQELSTTARDLAFGWTEFIIYQSNGNCPTTSDTLMVEVLQLGIPTGFSPNGDNVNDTFYVTGIEKYESVQLIVFNRWGNEVYKSLDYKNDWGGSDYNGNLLEDDTYYMVLTLDNEEFKGYVVIKK